MEKARKLTTKVEQNRTERADMAGHIKSKRDGGFWLPTENCAYQQQVRRTRDRKKLGESLNDAEQRSLERGHKTYLNTFSAMTPVLFATVASNVEALFRSWRPQEH